MTKNDSTTRELIVFFTVTLAISWTMAGFILAGGPEVPLVLGIIFGPSLGAIITTGILGGGEELRALFRRYIQVRAPWYVYGIITIGFMAAGFAGVALWRTFGGEWNRSTPAFSVIFQVMLFQLLLPGLGEEPGWRGFALPRLLRRMGPLPASLILGCIHWVWHLPTFFLGTGMHNVPAIWSILYIIAFTIVFTWVAERSNHSIFIAILFHGLHGVMLSTTNFLPPESLVPITPDLLTRLWVPDGLLGPYMIVLGLFWLSSALIVAFDWGERYLT